MSPATAASTFVSVPLGAFGTALIWQAIYMTWRHGKHCESQVDLGFLLVFLANASEAFIGFASHNWASGASATGWAVLTLLIGRDRFGRWWRKLKGLLTRWSGKAKAVLRKMMRKLKELKPRPVLRPLPLPV